MARLIKRYGSRKLYDTTESRYILLEDIAEYVRNGQEILVVDNKTQEDVTSQTLTQVISEEGRKKANLLSPDLLHDLIRAGETMTTRVRQLQSSMDQFVKKSFDKIVPLRSVRDEMEHLRNRLEELEYAVAHVELSQGEPATDAEPITASTETPEADVTAEPKKKTSRKSAKPIPDSDSV